MCLCVFFLQENYENVFLLCSYCLIDTFFLFHSLYYCFRWRHMFELFSQWMKKKPSNRRHDIVFGCAQFVRSHHYVQLLLCSAIWTKDSTEIGANQEKYYTHSNGMWLCFESRFRISQMNLYNSFCVCRFRSVFICLICHTVICVYVLPFCNNNRFTWAFNPWIWLWKKKTILHDRLQK